MSQVEQYTPNQYFKKLQTGYSTKNPVQIKDFKLDFTGTKISNLGTPILKVSSVVCKGVNYSCTVFPDTIFAELYVESYFSINLFPSIKTIFFEGFNSYSINLNNLISFICSSKMTITKYKFNRKTYYRVLFNNVNYHFLVEVYLQCILHYKLYKLS